MPIFLIEYDRKSGQLMTLRTFDDSERERADDTRLELELRLNRERLKHEVVLLEASSEDALRTTHRRYFEELADLATSPATSPE
jgi:hypothetical protein